MTAKVYYPSYPELCTLIASSFDINIRVRSRTVTVTPLDEVALFEMDIMGIHNVADDSTAMNEKELNSMKELCMIHNKRITYL